MAYKWIHSFDKGGQLSVTEFREKADDLEERILDPAPTPSEDVDWKRYDSEVEAKVTSDSVIDEIQSNLDVLRSENYCRGHHNAECSSDNALNDTAYHNSRLNTENSDYNSTLHATRHGSYNGSLHSAVQLSVYGNDYSSANVSYHGNRHSSEI